MTAKQLKNLLKGVPDDAKVILSADEEGNRFQELYHVSEEAMKLSGHEFEPLAQGSAKINSIVLWPA